MLVSIKGQQGRGREWSSATITGANPFFPHNKFTVEICFVSHQETNLPALSKLRTTTFVLLCVMSHLSGPTAKSAPIRCPPWCRPRVPEDREGEQRWVILASVGGVRPSSPLEVDSFGKVILHFYGSRRRFTCYTLEVGVEEGIVVVEYDSVQQCWKQLGLPSGIPNLTVAFSTQV